MFKTGTAQSGTPSTAVSSIYTLLQKLQDVKPSDDDTIYDYITDEYSLGGGRITGHEGVKDLMVIDIEHFAERVKNAARGRQRKIAE